MKQTTRLNGKRVVITTTAAGKVKVAPAPHTEEDLQAAQVSAMRRHPAFNRRFTFAGDQNAERRGPKARAMAQRTGMMAGEPDVRISFASNRLVYVENKGGNGPLSPAQKERHTLLTNLGFAVRVVRANTPEEASAAIMAIVDANIT